MNATATPVLQDATTPERRRGTWWAAIALTVLTLTLYAPVLGKLVRDWWTIADFSHGFFVPLFSGYVAYRSRRDIARVPIKPSWLGLPVIALALATLIVGRLGAELFLSRASLVLLLAGFAVFFWGWGRFRKLLFPLAFLLFMIPIPAIIFNQITFPLQLLASTVASYTLPVLGVPVLREGNVIHLPTMPLEVAEACSGIRSLMSLGTLAVMFGYFMHESNVRRVVLVVASIPIAVAANAIRVIGTGVCVQYWDADKALGFFHEFSGWVIFLVSLALLYAVHSVLQLATRSGSPEQ